MPYELFWNGPPEALQHYIEAEKLRNEQQRDVVNFQSYLTGFYTYQALCCVSPVLHAFAKKGTKPLEYPKEPVTFEKAKPKMTEEQKVQAEQYMAYVSMRNRQIQENINKGGI